MRLAYIRGYVTATVKHPSLAGARLLIAQPVDMAGQPDMRRRSSARSARSRFARAGHHLQRWQLGAQLFEGSAQPMPLVDHAVSLMK